MNEDVAVWLKSMALLIIGLALGVAVGLTITELSYPGFGWAKVLG